LPPASLTWLDASRAVSSYEGTASSYGLAERISPPA